MIGINNDERYEKNKDVLFPENILNIIRDGVDSFKKNKVRVRITTKNKKQEEGFICNGGRVDFCGNFYDHLQIELINPNPPVMKSYFKAEDVIIIEIFNEKKYNTIFRRY